MNNRFVITVTRECGSRGEAIAKIIARQLGIPLYSSDMIHQAAQRFDISGLISSKEEIATMKKRKNNFFYRVFFPGYHGEAAVKKIIFTEREKVLRLLADNENCVFLGNYSDFTLHDCPYAIHLYIYASYETRTNNYMEDLGLDREEAQSMVKTADEAMAYGYNFYTGYNADNKAHKHIMVDSSVLGVEGTAAWLVDLIRRRFEQ